MLNELIIPASELDVVKQFEGNSDQLGYTLKNQVFDSLNPPHVVLLGLPEGRGSGCIQVDQAPHAIRQHLYSLSALGPEIKIVDLGNIKCGNKIQDTYAAVKMVAEELYKMNISLLILGGSQEISVPLIEGCNKTEFNLVIVDDRIDNRINDKSNSDESYINNMPIGTSVSVIAAQSYFFKENEHNIELEGYNGEIITLGEIRSGFKELEPLLRKSDFVSFDFGSIKSSEAPGQYRVSPNGLTGEEACRIAWYSGMSTKPVWFGLFGYNPFFDSTTSGAMMAAQICWYFVKGISKRTDDEPVNEASDFEHYHIAVDGLEESLTFLRHPVSHRWWMEVPAEDCTIFPVRIPCSKKDYRKACKNEISERWWKYFSKI